ncbi:NmrA family NAD(P)-binding protein [Staphylococcus gallinarum]|nr:NmrA family NAD(P)-binding protein [Staphylococcus gallinarum]MEB6295946.1 NmrA family NAD(P)-binding protein [Staphylococcus gallinarum]
MEGFKYPGSQIMAPQLENGLLFGVLSEDTPIKLNSSEDTARFARNTFERPEDFNKADINIAGSELSMKEITKIISEVKNMEVVYRKESYEKSLENGLLEGTIASLQWMEAVLGYGFDIKETEKYDVTLKDFKTWVKENKEEIIVNKSYEN